MGKKEVMDYVFHTTENTNPAILLDLLDGSDGSGTSIRSKEITLIVSNVDDLSDEVSCNFGFYPTEQDQEIIDSGLEIIHGFLEINKIDPHPHCVNASFNNMPSGAIQRVIFTAYFLDDSDLIFETDDVIVSVEGECESIDSNSYKITGDCHFNLEKNK